MLKKMTELKPRIEKTLIFLLVILISVSFIIFGVFNFFNSPENLKNTMAIIACSIIIIFSIPPLIIAITYFCSDLTKKVFLDETRKQIIIKKRGKEIVISQEEIMDSFCVQVDDFWNYRRGYRFPMFKYILLVLKERKRVVITNLLCEPELIKSSMNLKCKLIYTRVPFINWTLGGGVLTTKEYEAKVLEFEKNFQQHSDSMLAEIINQKKVYADYAREAATRILNKRKH
jgi:hypothetical protein